MAAQALSGIAKDLTKMSAKSAIKVIVPTAQTAHCSNGSRVSTGSKNALKGVGFFVGGVLLAAFGFAGALVGMAGALVLVSLATVASLSGDLGRSKKKVKFTSLLSKSPEINWLSAARLFLFASRDVWFVVGSAGVPQPTWMVLLCRRSVFSALGDRLRFHPGRRPGNSAPIGRGDAIDGRRAVTGPSCLLFVPLGLVGALRFGARPRLTLMVGLAMFAVVFAINSAIHSYLVLAYTDEDSVASNVGFYYMANAGGRLLGTLLSGSSSSSRDSRVVCGDRRRLCWHAAILSLDLPRGHAVSLRSC